MKVHRGLEHQRLLSRLSSMADRQSDPFGRTA